MPPPACDTTSQDELLSSAAEARLALRRVREGWSPAAAAAHTCRGAVGGLAHRTLAGSQQRRRAADGATRRAALAQTLVRSVMDDELRLARLPSEAAPAAAAVPAARNRTPTPPACLSSGVGGGGGGRSPPPPAAGGGRPSAVSCASVPPPEPSRSLSAHRVPTAPSPTPLCAPNPSPRLPTSQDSSAMLAPTDDADVMSLYAGSFEGACGGYLDTGSLF
eukprot:Rhum_TRINITY_DN15500_c12_g1::Rhum_TRINITY_DN15500_c12_g1_i1::g.161472::m.161472